MSDEHRVKIANSNILNRLIKAALGEVEMSSVQAQIALGLMKKVMPDLASVEHSGDVTHNYAEVLDPLPNDEWQRKYSRPTSIQ